MLNGLYNHLDHLFQPNIRNHVMMTPYIKKMVNMDLIDELEKITDYIFSNEEKEIILNILKNSCSALRFALHCAPDL